MIIVTEDPNTRYLFIFKSKIIVQLSDLIKMNRINIFNLFFHIGTFAYLNLNRSQAL
jgi:hypothetical protein